VVILVVEKSFAMESSIRSSSAVVENPPLVR